MKRFLGGLAVLSALMTGIGSQAADTRDSHSVRLREAGIPATARQKLLSILVAHLRKDDPEVHDPEAAVLSFWVEFPQLSQDGSQIVLVASNLEYGRMLWVFRRTGDQVFLLLSGNGRGYGPYSKIFHHGMRDFQISESFGGEVGTEVFRFDGVRYRTIYCETLSKDGEGNLTQVHRGKCGTL